MDVQGSQYHLIDGKDDWGRCLDATTGIPLASAWPAGVDVPAALTSSWEYDGETEALRLRRDTPLFRRAGRVEPVDPTQRRGADLDAAGYWYWISPDRRGIARRATGAWHSDAWWSVDDLAAACTCGTTADPGSFAGTCTCGPVDVLLAGLCVTTRDYLLAGYAGGGESGLLVFDLRGGGAPVRMPWRDVDFDPWDLARTPGGGALVLDRSTGRYWSLDEQLRLRAVVPQHPIGFSPAAGGDPVVITSPAIPRAVPITDSGAEPVHPISIEAGPGETVLLLLDSDTDHGYSRVLCYDRDTLRWEASLENAVAVIDEKDPNGTANLFSLRAQDFAYQDSGAPLKETGMLFFADAEGDQVVAFHLDDPEHGALTAQDDFLPLRQWGARALVATSDSLWYDYDEPSDTRWVSVQVYGEYRFVTSASLVTAVDFGSVPSSDGTAQTVDGGPFDSRIPRCVWHRLLLDASLPSGATLRVRARASDDPGTIESQDWLLQPTPYLRSDGSELPFADPWLSQRGDLNYPVPLPDGMGTWELLFQQVTGRYLQVELSVTGPGQATPLLKSLRAWYPRFSYVTHYLPAVYAEHDEPIHFLERFLANQEGFYTALEEKIEHSALLLDARTAPVADLPWLAGWFGLAVDPQWNLQQRRFLVGNVDRFYRLRGTPIGLVATLRVYIDGSVDDTVFAGGATTAGGIRVVERFLTRDILDPSIDTSTDDLDGPLGRAREAAHRFDVLVPSCVTDATLDMVRRIIEQSKPAHTLYRLRRYYQLFVVGQARLGVDSELGDGARFQPITIGQSSLQGGYLAAPYPFNLTDRIISDRDRLGSFPKL